MSGLSSWMEIGIAVAFVVIVIPLIANTFLRNVEAGTIRLVSWLHGGTVTYRGPGKSKEIQILNKFNYI
jgi:flotillin